MPSPSTVRARILIWAMMLLGGMALSFLMDFQWFRPLLLNTRWHVASALIGFMLLKLVFTISKTTGRTLARYGRTGDLPRFETNQLVTRGPYACMRHPMHLGLLFLPLAIALIVGSPSFILIISPIEMIFMLVMIMVFEEREAYRKFGQAYLKYQASVPPFSVSPSCLKKLLLPQQGE